MKKCGRSAFADLVHEARTCLIIRTKGFYNSLELRYAVAVTNDRDGCILP